MNILKNGLGKSRIYFVYSGLSLSVNSTGITCALELEPALEVGALYAFHQRYRSDMR